MPSTPIRQDDRGYLQESRSQVLRCVDALDDYQLRHPMTPTGTNLLGVVKHLIGIEAGYLGACLGRRPFHLPLPWIADESAEPNRDMWATEDESRDYILDLYRQASAHSDAVLDEVGLLAAADVPWWPEESRATTAAALLSRVLKDTAMHAGQLQILRELIDGRAGSDRDDAGDDDWWAAYCGRLEDVALRFSG
ncbi:DinB family protein [Microlunatus elymi]|uniref:DinB family protein n=1 Tax=Microlunatus elymi TaxID=2596828 RepID=A0A516PUR2_9ACTN|nr:DinB family protein [Microlunatus elymi]QDP94936.1 DinB family protein [Microlunatus elymi]